MTHRCFLPAPDPCAGPCAGPGHHGRNRLGRQILRRQRHGKTADHPGVAHLGHLFDQGGHPGIAARQKAVDLDKVQGAVRRIDPGLGVAHVKAGIRQQGLKRTARETASSNSTIR